MKDSTIGEWIAYDDTENYTCSRCEEEWPKRFKRCPSCNAHMKNGLITFMEEYDGRKVSKEVAH